ncbi:FAD-dependent oxidoreductase [Phenylobacterium sp.]|uniref:flavin-containing monooxygenase n=1 Tax=Phenylobacterium sp. TaxID=1871053 RepID=UPI0028A01C13|nr:FAD-dependent oxidoreductase [Phenylobacterium sp.]
MGKRVCVVGAGPSGLTAVKTLRQAGLEAVGFEMSPVVGGHWVIDNPNGRAAAYRSLRTNTTKHMSRFSDFEMPAEWPPYPSHDQVRAWLESYVDAFGFRHAIHTRTTVTRAEPREGDGWEVALTGPDGATRVEAFDALVAASGSYWDARVPNWPGAFDGAVLHAQDYRDPITPFDARGKHVVVVGIGNTGCELACELAAGGAASVHIAARGGTWILPKTLNGTPASDGAPMTHPTDPVISPLNLLPAWARQAAFQAIAKARMAGLFGARMARLQAMGLPAPPDHPLSKRPTTSDEILGALESGAVKAKPGVERLDGGHVVFADGSRLPADLVLCATGYRLSYPYLDPAVADTRAGDLRLFKGVVAPDREDLFFVGVSRPTGSFWPIAEVQAQFVAAMLSGAYRPPPRAARARRARPILGLNAWSPAIYGLELREELRRRRR